MLTAIVLLLAGGGLGRTLERIAAAVGDGGHQVAEAASQVSSSSQVLAQNSTENAACLEETSASAEQVNSMARQNTDSAREAAGIVGASMEKFGEANAALDEMVTAMAEINESSHSISKIIRVIDEIAFQTNILALNAAVEAARAGEAGQGFAVVADEVRSLARRCAEAAQNTSSLIEESIQRSDGGKARVDRVAGAIRAVSADAGHIRTLVEGVSAGSHEQAHGLDQVSKAITQMQQSGQTTAATAEQTAAAAEEMTAQAAALRKLGCELSTLVHGAASA